MVEDGLLEEVHRYLEMGLSENNPALKALGYTEMIAFLRNELLLEQAIAVMQQKSRNYAKRQETWFRAMKNVHRLPVSGKTAEIIALEILEEHLNTIK